MLQHCLVKISSKLAVYGVYSLIVFLIIILLDFINVYVFLLNIKAN